MNMTFDEAYLKLYPIVMRYCYYRNDKDLFYAQEVASESFLVLLQKWDQLKSYEEKYLQSWLFGTAENKLKEMYRKNLPKCEPYENVNEYLIQQLCKDNSLYEETAKYNMYIKEIEKSLAPKDKLLFHCIVSESMTYQKTAEKMKLSENAVKLRWIRLREKIRPLVDKLLIR